MLALWEFQKHVDMENPIQCLIQDKQSITFTYFYNSKHTFNECNKLRPYVWFTYPNK